MFRCPVPVPGSRLAASFLATELLCRGSEGKAVFPRDGAGSARPFASPNVASGLDGEPDTVSRDGPCFSSLEPCPNFHPPDRRRPCFLEKDAIRLSVDDFSES